MFHPLETFSKVSFCINHTLNMQTFGKWFWFKLDDLMKAIAEIASTGEKGDGKIYVEDYVTYELFKTVLLDEVSDEDEWEDLLVQQP